MKKKMDAKKNPVFSIAELFVCMAVKFHLFGPAVVTGRITTAGAVSFQRLETLTEATLRYPSASVAELMV